MFILENKYIVVAMRVMAERSLELLRGIKISARLGSSKMRLSLPEF